VVGEGRNWLCYEVLHNALLSLFSLAAHHRQRSSLRGVKTDRQRECVCVCCCTHVSAHHFVCGLFPTPSQKEIAEKQLIVLLISFHPSPVSVSTLMERVESIRGDAPVLSRQLSVSVRRGELPEKRALSAARWVDTGVSLQGSDFQEARLMLKPSHLSSTRYTYTGAEDYFRHQRLWRGQQPGPVHRSLQSPAAKGRHAHNAPRTAARRRHAPLISLLPPLPNPGRENVLGPRPHRHAQSGQASRRCCLWRCRAERCSRHHALA